MKQWYTHLTKIESINIEIDKMGLSDQEKMELAQLVDSSLHHTILDAVFSQLQEQDKRIFIMHLREDNHDKIWQFLNEKVDRIEHKIKEVAEDLRQQLLKDIKEAKNK